MNTRRIVEVEYERPGVGQAFSVGRIRESPEYVVLIYQESKGIDLCDYIVIPKNLIKKTVELGFI